MMSGRKTLKEELFDAIFHVTEAIPIEPLLKRGASLEEPMEWGGAALHVAARYGTPDAIKTLLAHGANINQHAGGTPLFWAADQGRLDIVELLLQNGADANQVPLSDVGRSSFKPKDFRADWDAIKRRLVDARKNAPRLQLPKELQDVLAKHSEGKRIAFGEWFKKRVLPTYLLATKRASKSPQRPSLVGRLFGSKPALPVLPVVASKFGGCPYLETAADWPMAGPKRLPYLGQINFGELSGHVPDSPRQGILVLYLGMTLSKGWNAEVRWYPQPDPRKAVQVAPEPSIAKYEAGIEFIPSWDISSSDAWEDVLGQKDEAVWDAVLEWNDQFAKARGYTDGSHELFPQATSMLHEALDVREVTDIRTVLRISFDGEAKFDWGSNTLYFLIKNDDLKAGQLDRVTFKILNA